MPILEISLTIFTGLVRLPLFFESFAIIGALTLFCMVVNWSKGRG